jgi:hypothetical protein
MKTAEFGQPVDRVPQPGKCRICGCVETLACVIRIQVPLSDPPMYVTRPCGWADQTRTLCDNPDCIAEAKRELGIYAEGESR